VEIINLNAQLVVRSEYVVWRGNILALKGQNVAYGDKSPIFKWNENLVISPIVFLSEHLKLLSTVSHYKEYLKWGQDLGPLLKTILEKKIFISYIMRSSDCITLTWASGLAFRLQRNLG
jgi:hypothetical protein